MYGEGVTRGKVSIIAKPMTTNQACCNITLNEELADYRYVYYYLKNSYQILRNLATGVRRNLNSEIIKNFKIKLPDIKKQREIAEKLELYDKKIELNRSSIKVLDEYSQLLFHQWFIDFNFPNEKGEPYKDNGGALQIVNGKTLPLGWDYIELPKVCSIIDCLHSKKPERIDDENGKILLQLFNIDERGLINTTEKYYVSDEDYKLWTSRIEVKGGDLVITNAGRVGAIAQIPEGYKFGIGRNMTAIRPEKITPTFLYLYFNSSDIATQIKKNTDQGSFFGSLNVRGIKQLKIIKPEERLVKLFEEKSRVIRKKIELLNIESQNLIEVRDLLIKKLIG